MIILSLFLIASAFAKPSPDQVLQRLKDGNTRFVQGTAAHPNTDAARLHLAGTENQGDHAVATIIACSDSRVPVERIFDAGIMDLFVIRVAGNVVDTDEAGSIEYGLAHVHTPVLVVLGHKQCGAVTAVTHALQGKGHALEINIPPLVDNIIPAVKRTMSLHPAAHGDDLITPAIEENVWQGIEDLFMKSPTARNSVKQGRAKIVGAIYDVATGQVDWMPQAPVLQILDRVEQNPGRQMQAMAGGAHGTSTSHSSQKAHTSGKGDTSKTVEPVAVSLASADTMTLLKTDWLMTAQETHLEEHKPGLSRLFWSFTILLGLFACLTIALFGTGMFRRFSLNMKLYTSYGSLVMLALILGLGGYLYLEKINATAHIETAFLELDMMANETEALQNAYLLHGIENKAYGDKTLKAITTLTTEFLNDFSELKKEAGLDADQAQAVSRMESHTAAYVKQFQNLTKAYGELETAKETLAGLTETVTQAMEEMIHHHDITLKNLETGGGNADEILHQTNLINQLREAEKYLLTLSRAEVAFLLDKHAGRVEKMEGLLGHLKAYLNALENQLQTPGEKALLKEIQQDVTTFETWLVRVIKDEAIILKAASDTADSLHDIAAIGEALSHEAGLKADMMQKEGDLALIVLMVVSLVSGCLLSFFIARGISRPITHIIKGMEEGSDQVAEASSQVSFASQSTAEGASEQAASVEETSSSMEEMSSMIKRNAESAGQADQSMKETNEGVKKANQSMEKMTVAMSEISRASQETSNVIKTIDEIAFQTNLLALNAAVEAARAGEAGAGFAVVADEVRNLALRAAEAAKNTAGLIQGIGLKINEGSELVSSTNEAFGLVSNGTEKVSALIAEISDASREQSEGIEQINTAISEIDKVVQTNAANAEESAAASEQMNAQGRTA